MPTAVERIQALETEMKLHAEQCSKDKAEIKDELKTINNRTLAVLVFVVIQLLGLLGVVIIEGTPWEAKAAVLADRGERK